MAVEEKKGAEMGTVAAKHPSMEFDSEDGDSGGRGEGDEGEGEVDGFGDDDGQWRRR